MSMRRPTDRAAAWANWRARSEGRALPVGAAPECGFYKARRGGRFICVQIDLIAETDPDTGELLSDERYVAFLGADATIYDAAMIDEIWLRCAANPITEAEAERLLRAPAVSDLSREVIV